MPRNGPNDPCCEACGRSVAERFPDEMPPAYCDACENEFMQCLRAGKVRDAISGETVYAR